MTKLLIWAQNHPFKTITFLLSSAGAGVICYLDGFALGLSILAAVYVVWALTYVVDMRRLVGLAVALALCGAATPARSAPLIIGGLVIIVAGGLGFVGCKAIKKCQRIGKGRTNAWPEELRFTPAGELGESAAYFGGSFEAYCFEERLLPTEPTVITLTIDVGTNGVCKTATASVRGYEHTQNFWEFRDEMAAHGLTVSDVPGPSESYARNLQPCSADEVPISFDRQTQTVTVSGGGILLVVERSDDLQRWAPLMRVNVAPGAKLEVEDTTSESSQFYRVLSCAPGGCAD